MTNHGVGFSVQDHPSADSHKELGDSITLVLARQPASSPVMSISVRVNISSRPSSALSAPSGVLGLQVTGPFPDLWFPLCYALQDIFLADTKEPVHRTRSLLAGVSPWNVTCLAGSAFCQREFNDLQLVILFQPLQVLRYVYAVPHSFTATDCFSAVNRVLRMSLMGRQPVVTDSNAAPAEVRETKTLLASPDRPLIVPAGRAGPML